MQLSSDAQIPDGLLAAMTLLNEKPRLGLRTSGNTLHPGFTATQSTTALRDSWSVASETRWMSLSCEFGACGFTDTHGNTSTMNNYVYTSNLPLPPVVLVPRGGARSKAARGSGLPNCYGLVWDTIANDLGPSPSIFSLLPGIQESLGHASDGMASRAALYSTRATSYRTLMASSRALSRASIAAGLIVGDVVLGHAIYRELTEPCQVP
jgi:hypothetical protein